MQYPLPLQKDLPRQSVFDSKLGRDWSGHFMDDQLFLRPFTGMHSRDRVIATPSWIEMRQHQRSHSRPRRFRGNNGLHHYGHTVAFCLAIANAD